MRVSWLPPPPTPLHREHLHQLCELVFIKTGDNSKTSFLFYYVKEYLEDGILTSQGNELKVRNG
jgi:hypothetical protein